MEEGCLNDEMRCWLGKGKEWFKHNAVGFKIGRLLHALLRVVWREKGEIKGNTHKEADMRTRRQRGVRS